MKFVCLFTYLFVCLFTYLFVCLFTYLFVCLFIYRTAVINFCQVPQLEYPTDGEIVPGAVSMEPGVMKGTASNLAPKVVGDDLKSLPLNFPAKSVGASPHQAKFFMGEVAQSNKVVILKIENVCDSGLIL